MPFFIVVLTLIVEAEIDDWEKDFDLQVTDDDVKVAQDSINKITTDINTAITTGQDSNEVTVWIRQGCKPMNLSQHSIWV